MLLSCIPSSTMSPTSTRASLMFDDSVPRASSEAQCSGVPARVSGMNLLLSGQPGNPASNLLPEHLSINLPACTMFCPVGCTSARLVARSLVCHIARRLTRLLIHLSICSSAGLLYCLQAMILSILSVSQAVYQSFCSSAALLLSADRGFVCSPANSAEREPIFGCSSAGSACRLRTNLVNCLLTCLLACSSVR